MNRRVLVVAAHADDEVLGCGGTIAKWAATGSEISVAFLADGVRSRRNSGAEAEIATRQNAAASACAILGGKIAGFGSFPDNSMDTVPLLDVVQHVERLIAEVRPDTVLTHHAGDVNVDHRRIHEAMIAACRPQTGHTVRTLLFFEVASSTEWQVPGSAPQFAPNWYEDISATLDKKLAALEAYSAELRPWPHPRSRKGVEALAHWRGATAGFEAAEAFVLGRQLA